jgi:X-Pro dipeptidyl-peptidase
MLWRVALCAVSLFLACAAPAAAAPQITIGPDGKSEAVFDYEQAIRERVYIPQPGIDQDLDGALDWIAIEVMRPSGDPGAKFPAIVDPSPYYTTSCRGRENECIADVDVDGRNDKWPLFVDNYFVPRGYAYVLAEMNGTGNSTGCPMHGGAGDIAGMKSVIQWLHGDIAGFTAPGGAGTPVLASWSSGSAAMIGKSYDGTLANGVAATGVEGLETIVPIAAISNWYRYSRQGGIRFNTNYPATLSGFVTNDDRQALCAPTRTAMNGLDGDDTGDMNAFWDERNHLPSVGNVKASVFAVHGFQDDNVKLDHLGPWWDGLAAGDVPRKLWLLRGGHVDPFDSRRLVWVDTLHRWFDHWLLGVENGIMDEPRVTVEESADVWKDHADWPLPGSVPVPVYLRGTSADTAGSLALSSGGAVDTLGFANHPGGSENGLITAPEGAQATRRVFLSAPLAADLRISGTPVVDIRAALSATQSSLGAVLVDYGPGKQTTRDNDGVVTDPLPSNDCWGASTTRQHNGTVVDHSACYRTVSKKEIDVTQWRITRGILDSHNRNSLATFEPVTIGEQTRFSWPLVPDEHVIPKDHRLGLILVGNYPGLGTAGPSPSTITLDAKASKILLPVVGGYRALARTRAFAPEASAPVVSGMPADIVVDAAGPGGAVVDYALPTATDDETADPEVVCDPAPGSLFPVGATTVTCTASDAYGNASQHAFTVTVVGKGSPPPVQDPGGTLPPALDTDVTAPALRGLRAQLVRRALRVRFTLSEDATLRVVVKRKGAKRPVKVKTIRAHAGKAAKRVRLGRLRKGRYTVSIVATDAAGNAAAAVASRFRRR